MMTVARRIAFVVSLAVLMCVSVAQAQRPRVIITTDGEHDDMNSMVRFLLHADLFEVEGLVYSASKFHSIGHNWNGTTWVQEYIDNYAQSYDNLKTHSPHFPTPESLKSVVFTGNIKYEGDMSGDTPGSNHIAKILLEDDPRPVYLQAWGGPNTIHQALKQIATQYPSQVERVAKKAIIHQITAQDNTAESYLESNWPDVYNNSIHNNQFPAISYWWQRRFDNDLAAPWYSLSWLNNNIVKGHGPLAAKYRTHPDRGLYSEGDSPAFMHQMDLGLRSLEDNTWGGWGGRFKVHRKGYWAGAEDDGDLYKGLYRWLPAYQNEFAARADWAVTENYEDANHPPVVQLGHDEDLTAVRGSTLWLSAEGTTDPDGDKLTYKWAGSDFRVGS